MSEAALNPKLRFPEFSGKWKTVKLFEIVDVMTDYVAAGSFESLRNNVTVYEEPNYAIYLRLTDLRKNIYHRDLKYVDKKSYDFLNKSNLYGGEILMANIGANVGDVYFMPAIKDFATIAPNMIVIRENASKFKSIFLFYWFNTILGKKSVNTAISGSGQPKINKTDLKQIKVSFTSKSEQQKIASFLTSVDTKIEQLSKKQELLQKYKKGLMQKIFSQEIRFKADDGSNYPDWEEKKLEDISVRVSSNISANTLEDNYGQYRIYGASGYLKCIDFYTEKESYIAIVKDGAGVGKIMLCEPMTSVLGTLVIIKTKGNNNIDFLYRLLHIINFKKYIVGSTIPHIYYRDFKIEKLNIPSLSEQTKIANFLSSIDSKIEQIYKQLDETKQFKKALLQQMFV